MTHKIFRELNESKSSEKFYIPKEVLEGEDFQKALNTYMSQDRKIAKMTIILDVNPYSKEAMPIIQEINKTIDGTVKERNYMMRKQQLAEQQLETLI